MHKNKKIEKKKPKLPMLSSFSHLKCDDKNILDNLYGMKYTLETEKKA